MFHYLSREKQHTSLYNKNVQVGCFSGTSRHENYSVEMSRSPVDELCFWRIETVNINYNILVTHAPMVPKKSLQ
jgi:hypothetical protein